MHPSIGVSATTSSIRIAHISEAEQLRELETLQVQVWGTGLRDIVPVHALHVIATTGGIVVGAYEGDAPIGFAMGFLARQDGRLYHASHMLGIHPDYQGRGIGAALKWAQRDRALAQHLELMTWTFDPLEARNAYFNLHKLGVISRTYKENVYGELDDNLNRGLPSDRLLVEWHLREVVSPRVAGPPSADRIETTILSDQDGRPTLQIPSRAVSGTLRIETPRDIQRLKRESPPIALAWRACQRDAFGWALERGYIVQDFSGNSFILTHHREVNDAR